MLDQRRRLVRRLLLLGIYFPNHSLGGGRSYHVQPVELSTMCDEKEDNNRILTFHSLHNNVSW